MKSFSPFRRSLFGLLLILVGSLGAMSASWASISASGSATVSRVSSGNSTLFTVAVTPGSGTSGITVTADLSAFGGSSTSQLYDDGTHGDVTAGDNTFSVTVTVPANQAGGPVSFPVSVSDAQGDTATTSVAITVLGNFTIFHTNDFHARITPHEWIVPAHGTQPLVFQEVGGAAYQAAELLSLTTANPNSLVLDGGDISEGNPIGDFSGTDGTPNNAGVVGAYQLISKKLKTLPRGRGIDAWVVGNHDVRYAAYINNLANQTDFPVISINVCKHGTTTPYFQPYVTVTVNGTKVGIIGYTTESSTVGPDLANTIDVVKCDWSSTNSAYIHLANTVNTLRNTLGCDVVILLTHDGHSDLCTQSSSKTNGPVLADTTAAKIPEIAITGHWHTYCESVWQPSILNYKTIFTESSSFSHYVGELNVTGNGSYISSAQHVLTNSTITPDPDLATYVQNEINTYNSIKPLGYTNDQILGYTASDLVLDKIYKWWSADEYPWDGNNSAGNYICDGEKWAAAKQFGQCDLAIEVGGGVRADIPAGPLTFTNIYEMFPWSDDQLWEIQMSGQEIWNFIQSNSCDAGISSAWHITANNGVITAITYNGNPISLTQEYNVAINSYIFQNNTFVDQSPQTSTYLCRQALMDYAGQFPQSSPYQAGGDRYTLNTGFSGGYTAVVTMMNDSDSSTAFDDGFIRLMGTTSETLGRLGSYQVPTSLVNPDGSVNRANPLAEIEWYRSYLGFKKGVLHNGDIVQIYGKGGFYNGDPEFVDSEGIQSNGVEFNVIGHDATLSQPEYYSSINQFFNTTYLNHYVKFYAKKTGASTVADSAGTSLAVQDVTAFSSYALPGNVGDLLQLTGVATSETSGNSLRFRCDSAIEASSVGITGFPPSSQVTAIPSGNQGSPIQLTATASGAPVSSVNTVSLTPIADAEVASGHATTNYGSSTNIYIQSAASGYGNERGWLKFDLSSLPSNANITGARLIMYNWKAAGAALPTSAYGGSSDSWTETGLTWNNQPSFGAATSTVTLNSSSYDLNYTWDVTSFAQSKFAGYSPTASSKPISILVKAVTEGSTDATSPSYGFDSKEYGGSTIPVLQVDMPSTATSPSIAQVQYYYRYSSDSSSYGAWTLYQASTTGPNYAVTFNYPSGQGYYEFYSVATDSNGVVEPNPALYDTATTYNVSSNPNSGNATDTPTLPQWGLIALSALLFGFAAKQLRTRLHLFLLVMIAVIGLLFLVSSHVKASTGNPAKQNTADLLVHL